MRFSEYVTYDAVDLARLVSKGEVTSSELSATACAAIEAYNGQITLSSRPSLRPSPRWRERSGTSPSSALLEPSVE
jgi:hypothetical protein